MKKNTVADGALLVAAAAVLACIAICSSAAGEVIDVEYSNESTGLRLVPAIYVFGDSLVDVGNNNFLPPPAPRADPPCGVDLPHEFAGGRAGRFTNGYNLVDIVDPSSAGSNPEWEEGFAGSDDAAGDKSVYVDEQGEVDFSFDSWDE